MSYCPVPDVVDVIARDPTPASLTLAPPATTGEICNTSTTTTTKTPGGTPISTTTTIAGPPGPPGPKGAAEYFEGLHWAGLWTAGTEYKQARITGTVYPNADVVKWEDRLYVCTQDHMADLMTNQPRKEDEPSNTNWQDYWTLMVAGDTGSSEEKGFIESLKDDFFDWLDSPWSIGDWLGAAAAVVGIVWAGSAIADAMSKSGKDASGAADVRYNGSASFVGAYAGPSVRNVVESLCLEAGIASYDVSLLSNTEKCHFSLSQQTTVRNILENLSKAFQFDMVDSSGILKFVPRTGGVVRTLSAIDLGFNSTGQVVAPITTKRLQSIDLPRSVTLSYIAEDLDYNTFSQRSEIPTFSTGNDVTLEVPFMLGHQIAKDATDRLLIGSHLERTQYFFKTSYEHIDLEPGDVIAIPGAQVRIMQIEETEVGILEFICTDAGVVGAPVPIVVGGITIGYTASTYVGTGLNAQTPAAVLNTAPVIGYSDSLFIDPPVFNSSDTEPRIYAMVHGFGEPGWPGAQVFWSKDNGGSYVAVGSSSTEATFGMVTSPISGPIRGHHIWDDTTTITVVLKTGALVTRTDSAVLGGENMCMIGREVISFGVATLTAPNTYQLSHLLRGRRGSEWACNAHVANELFIILNNACVEIRVPDTDRGATYLFKTVTNGGDLVSATAKAVQIIGENTIPWTPAAPLLTKTGTVWDLNWIQRPRYNNVLRDYTEIDSDADYAGFAITVYDGAVVKRQEVATGTSWTYTDAMQTTDFGTAQTSLKIGIATISRRFGGGREVIVNS